MGQGEAPLTVSCPYCEHAAALDAAPAGQYTVACPDCSKDYLITVPEDPAETLQIAGEQPEVEVSEAVVAEEDTQPEETEAPEALSPQDVPVHAGSDINATIIQPEVEIRSADASEATLD